MIIGDEKFANIKYYTLKSTLSLMGF